MNFKAIVERYKKWAIDPQDFPEPDGKTRTCVNCGYTYTGNFCPRCGQEATEGPVTWRSVMGTLQELLSVKDPGGTIPYIMQIFGRPGYFINDYICGRKKVCKSPILYLGIMAACAAVVQSTTSADSHYEVLFPNTALPFLGSILNWLSDNLNWAVLLQTALLVLPTWLLFRNSPRHKQHTIVEGIYIQVFMSSLVLFAVMVRCISADWVLVLIPIFYFIAYRQLFGYSVWGTIWRIFLSMGSVILFFGVFMMAVRSIVANNAAADYSVWSVLGTTAALSALLGLLLLLGNWIDRVAARKREAAATSD